jgi:hypothetical protein
MTAEISDKNCADSSAGAPANEIEITPEMIEAGLEALYRFPIEDPFESEMRKAVAAVYRAMVSRSTRTPAGV